MKAISIRQPWAWAILHAGKDVENRTWRTHYRGPLLIHAGAKYDYDGAEWMRYNGVNAPERFELDRGGFVGSVNLVDCVESMQSPWFFGPYGFVFADPQPFAVMSEFRGRLGLFNVHLHEGEYVTPDPHHRPRNEV